MGCPDAATSGGSCKADDNCLDKANFPACDTAADGGKCFKCTASSHALCTGETPHCDNHECVACVDDNDCDAGAGVCLPSGGCAVPNSIIHAIVNGAGGSCGGTTTPCSLDAALIIAKTGPKIIKLDVPETYTSATNFVVDVDAPGVTIDARNAILHRSGSGPVFTINDSKGMTILGGTIESATGSGADGIRCNTNATLGVYGTTIQTNAEFGINSTGCAVTLSRSTIMSNRRGGISVTNAKFEIVGNIILGNGDATSTNASVTISPNADAAISRLEFNTIANNATTMGIVTAGVDCKTSTGFTASHNIIWNNSIGGNASTAPQVGNNCMHVSSAIGPTAAPGTGNISDPPLLSTDGHLGAGSPAIKKVETGADLSGLASRDIDGDRRIAPADLGADQLPRP